LARSGKDSARATLRFSGLGAAGDGVAAFEGRRVFARGAAPGDIAVAEIHGDRARIVEWVETSPFRRPPECPHAAHCGGCALQHIEPKTYAEFKRRRIVDALARVGVDAESVREPVLVAAATRRRATFAVRRQKEGLVLGFSARRSHEIVEIDGCKILHPELHRQLPVLRRLAEAVPASEFNLHATLCDNGLDVNIVGTGVPEHMGVALARLAAAANGLIRISVNGAPLFAIGKPVVRVDGIEVWPPPGAFLQASREGEDALIALVRGAAGGARRVADLFSGCGTFALPLARAAQVEAFDADKRAIAALDAAVKEAQRNGRPLKAKAETRDLFHSPLRGGELGRYDAIVFDPPRVGAIEQAREIAGSAVPLVVGVSCNPETFARDAAILLEGGYRLLEVAPVDQFVYSAHIELAAVFRRP